MSATASVHVRVDAHTKVLAVEAWNEMGLSVSDAVRLFIQASADGRPLPIKVPNASVIKAMDELENGRGEKFATVADLFEDLGI